MHLIQMVGPTISPNSKRHLIFQINLMVLNIVLETIANGIWKKYEIFIGIPNCLWSIFQRAKRGKRLLNEQPNRNDRWHSFCLFEKSDSPHPKCQRIHITFDGAELKYSIKTEDGSSVYWKNIKDVFVFLLRSVGGHI